MNRKNNIRKLKEFGIVFGIFFPLMIGFLIPIVFNHGIKLWTLIIGISFITISLTNSNILFYPYKIWMKVGEILGWINSRIIFSLIFVFVLLPISFIMKLLNHNPLQLNISQKKKSFKELITNKEIDLKRIF